MPIDVQAQAQVRLFFGNPHLQLNPEAALSLKPEPALSPKPEAALFGTLSLDAGNPFLSLSGTAFLQISETALIHVRPHGGRCPVCTADFCLGHVHFCRGRGTTLGVVLRRERMIKLDTQSHRAILFANHNPTWAPGLPPEAPPLLIAPQMRLLGF
jgi:hypothetical protein